MGSRHRGLIRDIVRQITCCCWWRRRSLLPDALADAFRQQVRRSPRSGRPRSAARTSSASPAGTSPPPFPEYRWPVRAPIWSIRGREPWSGWPIWLGGLARLRGCCGRRGTCSCTRRIRRDPLDVGRGPAAHPGGPQLLRPQPCQRHVPGSRGGGMAVDARRDHHRCGSGRYGDPAPRRVPGTILACGRCLRGGVERAAAELLRPARPPGAVNGGCPVLPRSLPLVSR